MVSWNAAFFVRHLLPLTLELTDPAHRISVWDNGSEDGSLELLLALERQHPGRIVTYRSRWNREHAGALKELLARTHRDLVVFLDCDAAPLRDGWVEAMAPPRSGDPAAAGIWFAYYLHPACLCTRRSTLDRLGVRIEPDYPRRDVLQDLTWRAWHEERELAKLRADDDYLFGGFGQTYGGGLVYHHWFGARLNEFGGLAETPEGRTRRGLAESQELLETWLEQRGQWRAVDPLGGVAAVWRRVRAGLRARDRSPSG
jgi:glycosyltransferase involved in cell wall biosynthesis